MAQTMSRRYQRRSALVLVPLALALAGCGGSGEGIGGGGGSPVASASLPQLRSDIAAFAQGQTLTGTSQFVETSDVGSADSFSAPAEVRVNANGNLVVTLFGDDYTLTRVGSTGQYVFDDPGLYLATETILSDHVGALLLVYEEPSTNNAFYGGGFMLVGTPSTDVGVQSGRAVYVGPSAFIAAGPSAAVNGGSGGFILEADFGSRSVDGVIALTDSSTSTRFQIGFENAPISGAGFSATNLQQNGLNATVSGSNLDAAFYGPGAAQVGGIYTMDLPTGPSNTRLTGVLIGNRQDFDLQALAAAAAAQGAGNSGSINVGGEQIILGSGSLIGGSGSVYPSGASTYYNSNTGVSFGADGDGCYYVGDWSNC